MPRPSTGRSGRPLGRPAAPAGSGSGRGLAAPSWSPGATPSSALLPAGGEALRRLDVTLLAVALEQLCGIDRAADRVRGTRRVHEVRGRGDRLGRRGDGRCGCGLPAGADAGRGDRGGRGRRRRDAPEVHLLLPQAAVPASSSTRWSGRRRDVRRSPGPGLSATCPGRAGGRSRRQRRQRGRAARPQGRDRAGGARPLHRVVAAGASLAPAAPAVRARRAGGVLALGALAPVRSPAAAGRATPSTCGTTTGRRRRTRQRSRSTRTSTTWSRGSSGSARTRWPSDTEWAASWS